MSNLPPFIEAAARHLCASDNRDPDAYCEGAPRVKNKKPTNLQVAAQHVWHHFTCERALMMAAQELHAAEEAAVRHNAADGLDIAALPDPIDKLSGCRAENSTDTPTP